MKLSAVFLIHRRVHRQLVILKVISKGQQVVPNVQSHGQTQTLQPVVAAPVVMTPPPGILSRFHWYHGVIAVGLLAASGAGTAVLVKNSIIPRLKSWVRRIVVEEDSDPSKREVAKPSLAEEAAAAAKAAAAAAADVARASQEMMRTRTEEKRNFEEFMHLLDTQVQEMKSLSSSIRKLEGQTYNRPRTYQADQEDYGGSVTSTRRPYPNGTADYDNCSARSASPPAPVESSVPHPNSYMEIMAMIQRGEKPSNIRDINDMPPNPNQQPSNPRIASRAKPWDSAQVQDESFNSDPSTKWLQPKNPRTVATATETSSFGSHESETSAKEQPLVQKRTWVPPQPPPVAMLEAAEAIRRPKPQARVDQDEGHDLTRSGSSGVTDELQKITNVSESGDEGSGMQINEIQEEQEQQ
ncbi:PREDICTED: peroxisomal membrane protein PEX14-like isoform X2 [Tarenaya hassleriana]|uniref:peroxisomal membrane protein PEX14-like isoform X2 n=1 Tax=Tarenaya hassleriana TaxID=28532 RepID=UPI00053C75CE|nr:PREDICTED: peroxisomal membrane protein PEX14-like isoform X2 [Tarenaya hassleriana]